MQELKDASLTTLFQQRLMRARRVARLLAATPFVRLVGLNGSLVTGRMGRDSDIDFYIATERNRLYTARLFVTLVVHLTGWRRYGRRVRGRVCLNRFATVENMDITPHNDYHARVFSGLEPLYAAPGTYERYLQANSWMASFGYPPGCSRASLRRSRFAAAWQRCVERCLGGRFGDWLEGRQAAWQRARIRRDPRTLRPGSRVFIRDNELCFHAVKE